MAELIFVVVAFLLMVVGLALFGPPLVLAVAAAITAITSVVDYLGSKSHTR